MPRLRLGAVIAVAVAAAFGAWLVLDREDKRPPQPTAVTVTDLRQLSDSLELGIFWAGPRQGFQYELTRNGRRVFVRYLPRGIGLGDPRAAFLTVGTYGQDDGFAAVQAASRRRGATALRLPGGGLAVYNRARPSSVYLSYPGAGSQVEVYHPDGATARRLVASGQITGVFDPQPAGATPASERRLGALAHFLQLPIHWAGPKVGYRYELTQTPEGRVFLRYLPRGVRIGDPKASFLTVGTYPQANGFAAVRAAARRKGGVSVKLSPAGGVAVYSRNQPRNVYLSYPKADYQVEVFHPEPREALRLVVSGQVAPID